MQAADMATMRVQNPHGIRLPDLKHKRGEMIYAEDRVKVGRQLRDDPLGQMHHRGQIGESQYRAGRLYQSTREAQGIGRGRSPSDLREHVDGGHIAASGISEATMAATGQIAKWRALLGEDGYHIVEAILIDKRSIREVADSGTRMMPGKEATKTVGHVFRRHLTTLARAMGLA